MIRNLYLKVIALAVLFLLCEAKKSEKDEDKIVFKEMVHWLNTPKEQLKNGPVRDGLREDGPPMDLGLQMDQQQVSQVIKYDSNPEQTAGHLVKVDSRKQNLKSEESKEGVGHFDSGRRRKIISTFKSGKKGKLKKDSEQERHSTEGKEYQKKNHKEHFDKKDEAFSKGHKGHSLRSKGHSNNGKNEEGFKNIWHKEESGREKKYFDNAEEKKYSAEHDHMKAFQNAASKGAFEQGSNKDLHLHDKHGIKLLKKEEGSFDKVLKEKGSHGSRKDYGRKKKFGRKGAHEEVFEGSKGNDIIGTNSHVRSHSIHEPVRIRVMHKRKSDKDVEESVQPAASNNAPLATVLQEAGYGQKLLLLPNKNLKTSQSIINEVDNSVSEEIDLTHKNKLKEKFLKLKNKNKKQLLKIPSKRKNRDRNKNSSINQKINNSNTTSSPTKNRNRKRNRGGRRRAKIPNRKIAIASRRLKRIRNSNKRKSPQANPSSKNTSNLKPIKEIVSDTEQTNKNVKMSPKNTAPISVFVLKHSEQNKLPKTKKETSNGHKKHFNSKHLEKLRSDENDKNNYIESETLDSSIEKPSIVKNPFISISEYKKTSKQPKIKKHFNLVTIRPKKLSSVNKVTEDPKETQYSKSVKLSPVSRPTEDIKATQQSKRIVIKPLEKEKSQQVSVVLDDTLKPLPSHSGHHKHNKPKKYATFKSFDEGHHKKKGKKVEKGGHQEHGYKGKSVKDHGKSHKSKFVDKEKKKEKGHQYKDQYKGHYDKGKKVSKGHAHGKKSHSHKGHSDKGFKNSHHKVEYAVKKNYYHDDENKKSHKVFDDFDAYFEKKRKENIDALNYHGDKHYNDYDKKGYYLEDKFHDSKKGKKKNYHHNQHDGHYNHHDYNSHTDSRDGHNYHKAYSPYHDYNALGSNHYNNYEHYE